MQQKPTEIHLRNAEYVQVYVNEKLVGECTLGHWEGRDDLMERVIRARRLEAMPRIVQATIDRMRSIQNIEDHVNASPAAKQQAFARGLMDGLERKTEPYPGNPPGVPPIPSEHTSAYRTGYDWGEALATLVRLTAEANNAKATAAA